MMRTLIIQLLVVGLVVVVSSRFPYNVDDTSQEEAVSVHYMRSYHGSRWRRSADDHLPDQVHFTLKTKKQDILLRLKRSTIQANIPVYVIRNNKAVGISVPEIKDSAVYTDNNVAASVLLTNNNREFSLEGTINIDGTEYFITPDNKKIKSGHVLKKFLKKFEYNEDGLETTKAKAKKLTSKDLSKNKKSKMSKWFKKLSKNGQRNRVKRSIDEHTVELLLIADFSVYVKFARMNPGNEAVIKNQIRQYYAFILNSIDIRYATVEEVDADLRIRVAATGIVVIDDQSYSYMTENHRSPDGVLQVLSSLGDMERWVRVQSNNNFIPKSDHYMLFTDYDIATPGGKGTVGVAYVAATCTDSSISIVEDFFGGQTAAIAAHELGHSLGSRHDYNEEGSCRDEDNYIMASYSSFPTDELKLSRPWTFSTCSVDAFKRYLQTVSCTQRQNSPDSFGNAATSAGQSLSVDTQCRMAFGASSRVCRPLHAQYGFDSVCTGLFCSLPDRQGYCGKMIPHEDTSCGDGMWCVSGICEPSSKAPRKYASCVFGDDPNFGCDQSKCATEYSTIVREVYCCETCLKESGVLLSTVKPPTTTQPPTTQPTTTTQSTATQPPTTTTQPSTTTTTTKPTSTQPPTTSRPTTTTQPTTIPTTTTQSTTTPTTTTLSTTTQLPTTTQSTTTRLLTTTLPPESPNATEGPITSTSSTRQPLNELTTTQKTTTTTEDNPGQGDGGRRNGRKNRRRNKNRRNRRRRCLSLRCICKRFPNRWFCDYL